MEKSIQAEIKLQDLVEDFNLFAQSFPILEVIRLGIGWEKNRNAVQMFVYFVFSFFSFSKGLISRGNNAIATDAFLKSEWKII